LPFQSTKSIVPLPSAFGHSKKPPSIITMSIQPPQGILNIPNATLRVGKLAVDSTAGFDTVFNNVERNTILLEDSTEYTETKQWDLKMPNIFVATFEIKGGGSSFNFRNTSNGDATKGYTLTFSGTTLTLKYGEISSEVVHELTTATIPTLDSNYGKVYLTYEKQHFTVTVDGTLVLTYKDTTTRTPPEGEYANFFAGAGSPGFKNLKVVAGHFISDGTSNIAYVGGGEVAVGKALAFNRVSNVSQIKVDSSVVAEYTGPHDRPLRKYPEVLSPGTGLAPVSVTTPFTGLTQSWNGYEITMSSRWNTSGDFNGDHAFDDNESSNWTSGNSPATYDSNGDATSEDTLNGVDGSYLIMKLPKAIKPLYANIKTRATTSSSPRHPKTGKFYGSNDGSSWTEIGTFSYGSIPSSIYYQKFNLVGTNTYQYIAVQVHTVFNDSGPSGTPTNGVVILDLQYYGHEEGSGSLDTTLKSVYNVPATTGTQLEVYYDAKDLTTMPSTVTDLAGGDQNGTVTGHSPTLDETNGIESFKFDGVDDYITTTLTNPNTDWVHSVSMWVYPIDVSDDSVNGYIFAIGPEVSNQVSALRFKPDGFNYTRWTGGGSKTFNGPVTSGRWHHVTLISPGSTDVQVYLDGRLLTHTSDSLATLTLPQNTSLSVGRFAASASYSRPFTGSIANFRLYSKALNADQVKELYDYQKDYFLGSKSQVTLYKGHLGVGVTEPSGQLELAGDERLQEYPPRAMTGYSTHIEGHGVFTVSASSNHPTYRPWYAFDGETSHVTNDNSWISGTDALYDNASTGLPTSIAARTNVNGGDLVGEWIQMSFPYKIHFKQVALAPQTDSEQYRAPKDATIVGSNDGVTWDTLHTFTNQTSWTDNQYNYYTMDGNVDKAYKYVRIIIQKIQGNNTYTSLAEVKFFGTPGPTTLDKGSLSLTRSLDVPRVSRYDVDTETPRPEKLLIDYDTTVNSSLTDISGKGNHGIFFDDAHYSAADKAFEFDGTDDYTQTPITIAGGNMAWTQSMWFKVTAFLGSGYSVLSFFGNKSALSGHIMSYKNNEFWQDWYVNGVKTNYTFEVNKWYHVVSVYHGNTSTDANLRSSIYINGVKQTLTWHSQTSSPTTLPTSTFYELADHINASNTRHNGLISNVKLYNVALEPSEAQKLYRLGRTGRSMVISDTAVGIGKVPEAQLDVRGTVNVDGDIFLNGFKIFQPITPIARDGLAVLLDASDPNSYPATGTIFYDTSGNGRHGTAQGSVGWTSSGQQSYFDFPGTDADKLNQTSGSALLYKDICIVFKVDALSSSFAYLVSNGGDTSLRVYDGNILSPGNDGDWSNGGTGTTYYVNGVATTADVPITNGQWYILGGESKCYSSAFNYTLGYGYPGRALDGKIAFVALYNRVLSADEQLQNYAALKKRFGV
jgi:hypothetical protein